MDVPAAVLNQVLAIPGCEGVIFAGSRQQGTARETIDWDFYVLLAPTSASFRRTWTWGDTLIEVFCNTVDSIRRHDLDASRVINPALDMLATGTLVFDARGQLAEIQWEARELVAAGPSPIDAKSRLLIGYQLRNLLDDLDDDRHLDATLLLEHQAVVSLVEWLYRLERRWMVPIKRINDDLRSVDPEWFGHYYRVMTSLGLERKDALRQLIALTIRRYHLDPSGSVYQERR